MADDSIEVWTSGRRRASVKRSVWEKRVLPGAIREAWNDFQRLGALIQSALEDGMAKRVVKAAHRLREIDPDRARGTDILAMVQLNAGRVKDADKTLQTFLENHDLTPGLLSTTARVRMTRGQTLEALALVRQALTMDPNHVEALDGWVVLNAEEKGDQSRAESYREITGEPGSYLPQVWLAKILLEQGDVEAALRLYEHVLQVAPDDPLALQEMSGALGSAGHTKEMLALLLPRYDRDKHGMGAGWNILQGLELEGRRAEAQALLAHLREDCPNPYYAEALDNMADLIGAPSE